MKIYLELKQDNETYIDEKNDLNENFISSENKLLNSSIILYILFGSVILLFEHFSTPLLEILWFVIMGTGMSHLILTYSSHLFSKQALKKNHSIFSYNKT